MLSFYRSLTTTRRCRLLAAAGLLALAPAVGLAQAPAWQAAQALGTSTSGYSNVAATTTDGAGNVYLAGSFNTSLTLGSTTLTTSASNAGFVAKWSPVTNTFVWALPLGSTYDSNAQALAVSGTSVYVGGNFLRAATFGSISLSGSGSRDTYVAKLTDAGPSASFAWARMAGNGGETRCYGLAVSGTSVYIGGAFDDGGAGRSATFGATTLTSSGSYDGYVAKLTDAGASASFSWAQRLGGLSDDYVYALAASGPALYVGGTFNSAVAGFGLFSLTSAGSSDAFVARLTDAGSTGSFAWAQRAGGPREDQVNALAVSGSNVYAAGSFNSTGATFGATTLSTAGYLDAFVTKLTDAGSSGSFAWARQAGGTSNDEPYALAVSGSGVFVAGDFGASPATFGGTILTSVGGADVFVTKLTDAGSTGSFSWALRGGGSNNDYASALALSGSSVYVGGFVPPGAVTFGAYTTVSPAYPAAGFVAGLRDGVLAAAPALGAAAAPRPYPNPAHGSTRVALPAGPAGTAATLTLLDALGRVVRTQATLLGSAPAEATLELAGVAPGVYALRVAAEGAATTSRLVVE